jgi:hypothetical protein
VLVLITSASVSTPIFYAPWVQRVAASAALVRAADADYGETDFWACATAVFDSATKQWHRNRHVTIMTVSKICMRRRTLFESNGARMRGHQPRSSMRVSVLDTRRAAQGGSFFERPPTEQAHSATIGYRYAATYGAPTTYPGESGTQR